jgi:GNAT superfamily N-acetyltransferase
VASDLRIVTMTNQDDRFYSTLGPYFSRREIVKELGSPVWDDDGKEWFVVYRGRTLVGFAALRQHGNHTSLVSAYVLPEHRKTGIYTALLRARVTGFDGNLRAIATPEALPALKRAGFKATGKRGKFTVMDRS